MLMKRNNRQSGFTVAELLITMALGLSIVGSILVGYLATYTSSMDTLAASKMNQDLNAVMNLMISEFRRAGYSGQPGTATNPTSNDFNDQTDTALRVIDTMGSDTVLVPAGDGTWTNGGLATQGSCILFAYDRDNDGTLDLDELNGFRLNNVTGAVEMRTLGVLATATSCATGTWVALTDPNFITVSVLAFNLDNSECINTREPDGIDNDAGGSPAIDNAEEADCYDAPMPAAASGDITVETRQIRITLTGNLQNDAFVQISLVQDVRVRNDLVRIR